MDQNPGSDFEQRLRDELAPGLHVLEPIGRGSMASVYLARETALRRLVAVKVLSPHVARDATARQRFAREAQAVASILHPHVVSIHRVDRLSDGVPFLVMQYVKGPSLADRLAAAGPMPQAEARRVIAELAGALAAAHQRGIVHRDVRPANVLCDEESNRILLTDFGLAFIQTSGSQEVSRLTDTGIVVGDPAHISPEQGAGSKVTDRADVYSLGVLAHELLTGRTADSLRSGMSAESAGLPDLPLDLDADFADVIRRCLATTPAHRPSAADVVRLLTSRRRLSHQPGDTTHAVTRLAAVVFADVAGYSSTSARNERAALAQVAALQEVAREEIERAGGRLVKFVGDAVLAQFYSTAASVQAALALRDGFSLRTTASGVPASLRIGVHAGDVTRGPDGDLYGDGVNTASRLQTEAVPGQVLVSGDVWRQLMARPDFSFRPLGEKSLKGLGAPVQLVEVNSANGQADAGAPVRARTSGSVTRARVRLLWLALGAVLLSFLIAVLLRSLS